MDAIWAALGSPAGEAVRNWATTIGGFVALTIGLATYRRNVRIRREEQARLVYSWPVALETRESEEPLFDEEDEAADVYSGFRESALQREIVQVNNNSREPIGELTLHLVDFQTGEMVDSTLLGSMEPESTTRVACYFDDTEPRFYDTKIIFRDSSGEWWRRVGTEPIELAHDDPALAEHMGYLVVPKVTLRIRRKRLARRMRGQTPLP